MTGSVTRRTVLHGAVIGGAASLLAACTSSSSPTPDSTSAHPPGRTLLAYFSRPGENYWNGARRTLEVGNTEVLATTISRLITCDVFRIEAAAPYPDVYDDTVARNTREQDADARPPMAGALPSLLEYDTVLVGSPIWNVRPPMIMSTFIEAIDVTGKRLLPFVTYAVSGLGSAQSEYERLAPRATVLDGLAVRGERVAAARSDIEQWLRDARLLT